MNPKIYHKPFVPFLITGLASLLIAAVYYFAFPGAYFDLSIENYFTVSNHYVWLLFAVYALFLAAIYYAAYKGKLVLRRWLVTLHFVFVLLFLVFFAALSSFNAPAMRAFLSGLPMLVVIGIYGAVFVVDVLLMVSGLLMLIVNIASFRREKE
jgi:hypothetical protein